MEMACTEALIYKEAGIVSYVVDFRILLVSVNVACKFPVLSLKCICFSFFYVFGILEMFFSLMKEHKG